MWADVLRTPARAALFVDFDGSLAPIVDDPEAAAPLAASVGALGELARRLAIVAIVTGRPVEFVRRHVPDPQIVVVGQYGLERDEGGTRRSDKRAARYHEAIAAAAADAERRWPALHLERKGLVAVTLHWRTVPEHAPDPAAIEELASAYGVVVVPGRMAAELRPPVPVDKGTAVRGLLAERDIDAAAFAGDDHGDLAAFAALDAWVADAPEDSRSALRIALVSREAPGALIAAADVLLDDPHALAEELTALAAGLR
jgi:trehalose 6-phosphate phosphatase